MGSGGLPATSCSCWCSALVSSCASSGTHATLRPMSRHTKCCRLWCFAVRRPSRLPSKVLHCRLMCRTESVIQLCASSFCSHGNGDPERKEIYKLAVTLCLSCRGCCGLSFLVPKCTAWSSGWNQEETM